MTRENNTQLVKCYLAYALDYLRKKGTFFMEYGYNSLDEVLATPQALIAFMKARSMYENEGLEKPILNALLGKIETSREATLERIQKVFSVELSYRKFCTEVKKGNQEYIRYIPIEISISKATQKIESKSSTNKIFIRVKEQKLVSASADHFYNAHNPTFSDIENNFDVTRSDYIKHGGIKDLIDHICNEIQGIRFFIIGGAGGTGKSTTLVRCAFDLSRIHEHTYYLNAKIEDNLHLFFEEVSDIIRSYPNEIIIFCIDEFSRLILPKNLFMLNSIKRQFSGTKVLFVLSDHSTSLESLKEQDLFLDHSDFKNTMTLRKLSDNDISNIYQKLDFLSENSLITPSNATLSKEEIIKICVIDSKRHPLVSFMQIREGKKFYDIIYNECIRLKNNNQFSFNAYLIICLFNKLRCPIPDDLLFRSLNEDVISGLHKLNIYCAEILSLYSNTYFPRHGVIGNEVCKIYFNNPEVIFKTILHVLRSNQSKSKNSTYHKFLLKILSTKEFPKILYTLFECNNEKIESFYGQLYQYEYKDKEYYINYYVSKGMFYHSIHVFNKVAEYFGRAHEIIPDNYFINNMLFRSYSALHNWSLSAHYCECSIEKANTKSAKLQSIKFLSYSIFPYFLKAKKYFEKDAKVDKMHIKERELYLKYYHAMQKLKISDDPILQRFFKRLIRPRFIVLNGFLDSPLNEIKVTLFEIILRQVDFYSTSYDNLLIIKTNIDNNEDGNLKGLYYRMLATALMRKHKSESKELDNLIIHQIQFYFNTSIELNPNDPFTYRYYAKFIRMHLHDFKAAEEQYRTAIEIADNSTVEELHRHPQLLNGLGYCLKENAIQMNSRIGIDEAEQLFIEAISGFKKLNLNYFLAEQNLKQIRKMKSQL